MRKPRLLALSLLAAGVALAAAAGCSDRTPDGTRIVRPEAPPAASRVGAAAGAEAKRRFHTGNPADWVGEAHNRAIDEYRARLRSGTVSDDLCNDLVEFGSDPRRVPAQARAGGSTRESRARLIRQVLRTMPFCGGRLATGSLDESLHLVQEAEISPEARAVLDEILAAAQLAPTSGDLAVQLNDILARSSWLPVMEYEIVQATSSVAQSSAEYWEANISATHADFDYAYGPCMQTALSLDDGAQRCMGLAPRITPTSFPAPPVPRLQLTQGAVIKCPGYNGREILGDDVKGAIGGAMVGVLAGGIGAGPGAGWGATASSTGTFGWQFAQLTWCVLGGGGTKPSRPAAT